MATTQVQGLPSGAVLGPDLNQSTPAPQVEGLPPGAVLGPDLNQSAQQTSQPPEGMLSKIGDVSGDVATGFMKGVGDTVSGVSHLLNKIPVIGETLAPSQGISALDKMDVSNGTAESAGKGLEGIAEFAAGDELMEGLSKGVKVLALAKKYPIVNEMMILARDHPLLAKIISSGGKAAVVGGVQGAVKGAPQDHTVEGAAGGAVGGALGGAVAEGLSAGVKPLSRILGVGGLNSTEALTKAGRPYVGEQNWEANLQSVLPRLVEADKAAPVKTVGDFEDLAHDTADSMWKQEIQPQVDNHATEAMDTAPIRTQIQDTVTRSMKKLFPDEAAKIEQFANNFGSSTTVSEANEDLQAINAKLKAYYKASPEARSAILKTDGDVTSLESAADALRDTLYSHLEDAGETIPRELRQQYGALKQVERVFGKRAIVADRQAPISMGQIIGMIAGGSEAAGALASGHPVAAVAGLAPVAIATAAKMRNAPESLIRQGLTAASKEASGAAPSVAGRVAKAAAPNVGSQIGQIISEIGNKNNDQESEAAQ